MRQVFLDAPDGLDKASRGEIRTVASRDCPPTFRPARQQPSSSSGRGAPSGAPRSLSAPRTGYATCVTPIPRPEPPPQPPSPTPEPGPLPPDPNPRPI